MKSDVKQIVILGASFLVGVLAFVLTHVYLHGERVKIDELRRDMLAGMEQVKVLVAARALPAGTVIRRADMAQKFVPKAGLSGPAVLPEEFPRIEGKQLLHHLEAESPVLWALVDTPYGPDSSLSAMVRKQLRAISIPVGGVSAVSGLVRPNDRIDVLGTFSLPSSRVPGEMEAVTMTVLQNVTVLATGAKMSQVGPGGYDDSAGRSRGYNMVTLEVTPGEAELLVFAQHMRGQLTLTLRNHGDMGYLEASELGAVNFEHLEKKVPDYNEIRQKTIINRRMP